MTKYRQKQIKEIVTFLLKKGNRKIVKDTEGFQTFELEWESEEMLSIESPKSIIAYQDAIRAIYSKIAKAIIFNPVEPGGDQMAGMDGRFSFNKLNGRKVIFGNNGLFYDKIFPKGQYYEYVLIAMVRLGNE